MKFCPECGTRLGSRWFPAEQRERLVCSACDAIRYENPRILVTLMIAFEDQVLLCRRAHAPAYGTWTPPSGFMEKGETLEEAACRETREEAGVNVSPEGLTLYSITNLPAISEVYVSFRASVTSPVCHAGSESLEVGFFAQQDIPWDKLAFPEMSGFLKLYFREQAQRSFGIHLSRVDKKGRFRRGYKVVADT